MAQRVKVELIDDIDGSVAAETIAFGLDGVNYQIDLSGDHAEKLREELNVWISNARRVGGRRNTQKAGVKDTQAIRAWAQEQGLEVSSRGRIPAEIVEAYTKAN